MEGETTKCRRRTVGIFGPADTHVKDLYVTEGQLSKAGQGEINVLQARNASKLIRHSLEDVLSTTCSACNEGFDTMQGLSAHQSMSKKCAWYKKGKLKEVFNFDNFEDSDDEGPQDANRLGLSSSHVDPDDRGEGGSDLTMRAEVDRRRTPINSPPSSDEDPEDVADLGSVYDFIKVSAPRPEGPSNAGGLSSSHSR
ncbi:uncharacterized protein B0H18DRAFT_959356 [Fomitopsis serialis]|uniref:uncharacterized protein n=1 Tax=Fomitopsis serialis TaxID=139415 RepID=UPI0020086FFB|nr:uncharacterized protein B0H18DRAFT_959356 [Neoantrodia serialis]KAH9915370.1 hypothetical protein B0H18DRAFT_959356 [Neoantrodia serialis]